MTEPIDIHDARPRRCPMLGHEVSFGYCRLPGGQKPCRKIADCWFETFDVAAWLRAHFSPEQIEAITARPADKRLTLIELIEQARQRTQKP